MKNCGIIEGYFGKPWSFDARNTYPEFLKNYGYKFFIYAPKNDDFLRKNWRGYWNDFLLNELKIFSKKCKSNGIDFGIGFTPMGLNPYDPREIDLLKSKINKLNTDFNLNYFALLFDDLKNTDDEKLALIQLKIIEEVSSVLDKSTHIIICPSYYSFDPILEKVFGKRPHNYWDELSKNLDSQIDIFWTGEKVCSKNYPCEHLKIVTDLFNRKPFIWDNYPVNDGKRLADYMFLTPFNYENSGLNDFVSGHAINPMREPYINKIVLATLNHSYQNKPLTCNDQIFWQIVENLSGSSFAKLLKKNWQIFDNIGYSKILPYLKQEMIADYKSISPNCYAQDVLDYLNGNYEFDPNCST